MKFLVFLFIVMITPLILYHGVPFAIGYFLGKYIEKEGEKKSKERMALQGNVMQEYEDIKHGNDIVKQGNDSIKIIFKESSLVSKIKYKSFLFVKIPLTLICYGVLISLILSFNFEDLNDVFSFKGFVSIAIISFLLFNAFKNYNYYRVLKIRVQEHETDGTQIHIILSKVTEQCKPSKLTGSLKYKYEYTFIWEGNIYSGIENDVNDHVIGKKLLDYLIAREGIEIPAKMVNDTIFVDPKLFEDYLSKKDWNI